MERLFWLISSAFYLFQVALTINASHLCQRDESLALLKFKQQFTVKNETSYGCDELLSYPKALSWNRSSDCCRWDGVTCDILSGHVIGLDLSCRQLSGAIQLNNSLIHLPQLQNLNLAGNFLVGPSVLRDVSTLTSLTFLNLSDAFDFDGEILPGISNLSNLTKLRVLSLAHTDLSSEQALNLNLSSSLLHLDLQSCGLSGKFPDHVFRLPNLETIILSVNSISGSLPNYNWTSLRNLDLSHTSFSGVLPDSISSAKSLNSLLLKDSQFLGSIPESIGNLTLLKKLDLSFNNFSGHLPSMSNLEQLDYLDLSINHFEGEIPDAFTHLQKLTYVLLGENRFSGIFPSSAINLSDVQFLDFSSNLLTGPLPKTTEGLKLQKLKYLSFSNNSLNGLLPSWLFDLPSLQLLALDNNQFTGKIHNFNSPSLWALLLNNNNLNGPFPSSISTIQNLQNVFLSYNNLSGIIELSMFPPNLYALDISFNHLTWSNNNRTSITFPVLIYLGLSSCEIKEFPDFLRHSNYLETLDLSNNQLHGQIPDWFRSTEWKILGFLDLSHNYLSSLGHLPLKQIGYLRLKSNLFDGPLPSYICSFESLVVLDMSDNNFSGAIPECYGNFSSELQVLDLRKNDLQGTIPTTFANNCQLINLGLNGNKLKGQLPSTLLNCQQLEVLDIGNNMLNGGFPYWLENLPALQVLILKSNRYYGALTSFSAELPFPNMRIFDLSDNEFTGILPEDLFKSFNGMINREEQGLQYMEMKDANYIYYQDSLTLVVKGTELEFVRVLNILTAIDLSINNFEGEIPASVGILHSLKLLNLSHNNLQGYIPPVLGDLGKLESLDLSWNKLQGQIPWQLTKVSTLAVLNLSENQLVGRIPEGDQFHTFGPDSYSGNLALCGFPLAKTCEKAGESQPTAPFRARGEEEEEDSEFLSGFSWKPVVMGYGCGLLLGLAMGCTMFLTGKPEWLATTVERTLLTHKETKKFFN